MNPKKQAKEPLSLFHNLSSCKPGADLQGLLRPIKNRDRRVRQPSLIEGTTPRQKIQAKDQN